MADAGPQQRLPVRFVQGIDQMGRQQHDIETPPEGQTLDPRADRLGSGNVSQHLRRLVHCHHPVPQAGQRVRHAAGTAAQFEDRGPSAADGSVDDVRFPAGDQQRVQVDRAAVGGNHPRSGSPHAGALVHPGHVRLRSAHDS
jgi:hypothetical protein